MRERLGEYIFDGEPFEEVYSGVPVRVARFVILESTDEDNGMILVSSHIENANYNEVPITPATARELAGKLIELADAIEKRKTKPKMSDEEAAAVWAEIDQRQQGQDMTGNALLARIRAWLDGEIELPNLKRGRDEAKARAWLETDWRNESE